MFNEKVYAVGLTVAAAAVLPFAAGCLAGPDETVAAVDGEHEITAEDLRYFYARVAAAGAEEVAADDVETVAREVLEAAITGKILELEAEARGFDAGPAWARARAAVRSQTLRADMRRRLAASVVVSEAEILDFYEKSRKRRRYSFIQTDSRVRAEEARAALEAGRPWGEVVAEYSDFTAYTGAEGRWEVPMEYAGDEASRALFAVGEGEYTGVVEGPGGLAWFLYRVDKVVHGSGETYEEAKPRIRASLAAVKTARRFRELAAGWRKTTPIRRDADVWRALTTRPLTETRGTYYGRDAVLSDVGGVPVYFDEVFDHGMTLFSRPSAEIDELREAKPDYYERVWEKSLQVREDQALLEFQAGREGADRTRAFRREMAVRRADMLIEKLYAEEFLPRIPEPTEAEIYSYYDRHKGDFRIPERLEVYLVARPDREGLLRFRAAIEAGADLVITGEARNRDRVVAERELYELPPPLPSPQQEWLGVVVVTADAPAPSAPSETPLAAELRPRLFPFKKLNVLSDVFRLRDGRWAFYEPIYYQPPAQRGLDDAEVAYYCRKGVWEEKVRSREVAAAAEAWIEAMRARHDVVVYEEALARVVADLRKEAAGGD